MNRIFIFGSSGHALDVADIVFALDMHPVFVLKSGAPLLTDEEAIIEDHVDRFRNESFTIGIGTSALRRQVADRYRHLSFPALIHPDTSFGRNQRAAISSAVGAVVFAGARFTHAIQVGRFCHFNLNATVSHDVDIGDYVTLSPGATVAGNVVIGDDVLIGAGATVNQGTPSAKRTIGSRTTIGSGAVVVGDCRPDSIYTGIPAKRRI